MTMTHTLTSTTLVLALAAPAFAQVPEAPEAPPAPPAPFVFAAGPAPAAVLPDSFVLAQAPEPPSAPESPRGPRPARPGRFNLTIPPIDLDKIYEQARQAIENAQFDLAIQDFDRVLAQAEREIQVGKASVEFSRADAAMYWKAYSQARIAESQEALQTIQQMSKEFATSPWIKDAKALAVEIQAANGQPISTELQNDEELKLLALRGLMQADPDKALPIIQKMLDANASSPRVRDRALFVLAQSRSARARDVMLNTARNNTNPDLQRSAIRYLGMMGGTDDREVLAGIYRSATDPSVKRAILQSYFMSGNVDRTVDIAKTEKDADLRRAAIHNLGAMRNASGANTGDALVAIYKSDTSSDIKRAVVNALFMQHNAKALVDLARNEKDAAMKREIVQKLSVMKAPEATDYMLELLK